MSYNVIIPVTERNMPTFPITVNMIHQCLNPSEVFAIGNGALEQSIKKSNCCYIHEDNLVEGLSFEEVKRLIVSRDEYAGKRAGWYFQQFLKMAYAMVCNKDEYLIWDADTIPVHILHMHAQDGTPFFDIKEEYHRPYFTTMGHLLGKKINRPGFSFISEHMLIKKDYMLELLQKIESNGELSGTRFFEKILSAIRDIDLLESGFSEFETYGNFVIERFPNAYRTRKLRSLRDANIRIISEAETKTQLDKLSEGYDIITLENR